MSTTIRKMLVANRGVPAVRIMQTCMAHKIPTTAIYSTPDRLSLHVIMADSAVHIGEAPPRESYLNMERIIQAAHQTGADAIHPGWGFLSENETFAQMVIDAGLTWIGPSPRTIKLMGDKVSAKQIARQANLPTIPGLDQFSTLEEIDRWMKQDGIDFPLMVKPSAGGGGKGMVKIESRDQLPQGLAQSRSEARKAFGDDVILVEKYIERGRHIEIQVVGDSFGNIVHLGERECTLQRRNQKIIEEAPSPTLDSNLRKEISFNAVRMMREIGYLSAGTVEFIYDVNSRKFYFLEANTRLQVEHGITELITGLDIVSIMMDVALGKPLPFTQDLIQPNRWAIEARLNAEDPKTFSPSFGKITRLQIPHGPGVRISSGVYEGVDIPPYYDSLFMLLMAAGADRQDAIRTMDRALSRYLRIEGVKTLVPLLLSIIRHPSFIAGELSTRFIEEHMAELVSMFIDEDSEDEVLKIARYVADISALGPQEWM